MKSYVEETNKRAQEANKRADGGADIKMEHTDIRGPETDEQRQARTGLSSVRITDDESKSVQKTPHRVSLDSMIEKVKHVDYIHPERHPHMTLAIVTLVNGFILVGKSTPADPENFNKELGMKLAYEDAIRQMWPLEAYLLREFTTWDPPL